MRVLFIIPNSSESAVARYRAVHIAEALALGGIESDIVSAQAEEICIAHDVVVLHRIRHAVAAPLIAAARQIGATVVYGTDDLIFSPEHAYHAAFLYPNDPTRFSHHRDEATDHLRTLCACDHALVSTEFLAREARAATSERTPVHVLRNVVSAELLQLSEEAAVRAAQINNLHERITLAYLSGSATHSFDFAEIGDALGAVLRANLLVRLMVVGEVEMPPALRPFLEAGRIRRHPFVPWRDLPGLLAFTDINLAPLDPARPFNHAKSEVKWLEAAACSVLTVAGRTEGFVEGVSQGDCVFVNDADGWEATLTDLAQQNRATLRAQGQLAYAALRERATTTAIRATACALFAAFAPVSPVSGSATVRTPRSIRIKRAVRRCERRMAEMLLRYRRHRVLLEEDILRGGTVQ